MAIEVIREERWEKGNQRVGFKVTEVGIDFGARKVFEVEVFRQQNRRRTRVSQTRRAASLEDALFVCQGVAAGFYANGFKPQMVWIEGQYHGGPASVMWDVTPLDNYTVKD